jgi:long-chain acyl-CoA synthetase
MATRGTFDAKTVRGADVREFSEPAVATIDDRANLTDPAWDNAEKHPESVQFVRSAAPGAEEITSAQFRDQVVALARGLIGAGVAAGDRVALMSKTRYEWTLADYAIWAAGAVTVPIYETSSPEQIQWILSDSGAKACIVDTSARHADAASVRDRAPDLTQVWQIEPTEGTAGGGLALLMAAGETVPAAEVQRRREGSRADDLATIIYTSGTTGRPKGCMITHRNILTDVSNAIPGLPNLFREDASTVLFLPLAHSFARVIQCGVVQGRVTTTFTSTISELAADLKSFQPTFVLSVPRVFEKVFNTAQTQAEAAGKGAIFERAVDTAVEYSEALDTPHGPGAILRLRHSLFNRLVYGRLRGALGGRCESAISGGAPLGARLAHFYRGIGLTVYEGYGLSETSPAISLNLQHHLRIGSVGRPLPGVAVRVADDGEIAIKGDIVFAGYWRNPEATAEVMDAEGWFLTGDLGHLDDDGFLTITGRKKEIIVTAGGKNVSPAQLEDRIRAHSLVSQCQVVGEGQPFVAALITLDEEASVGWRQTHGKPAAGDLRNDPDLRVAIQSAIDDANQSVSKPESIRVFRILPGDFTEANGMLTPSLKVKRSVVAKEYADEIAAIYR